MSRVINMMRSGKKILGTSSSSLLGVYNNRIHNNNNMGMGVIMKKNFSASSSGFGTGEKKDQSKDQNYEVMKVGGNASPTPSLLQNLLGFKKRPFTPKDKSGIMCDATGMHVTVDVANVGKENLLVFVSPKYVTVQSTIEVAATGKPLTKNIKLPQVMYDHDHVTGTIESDALKVFFPFSKQKKELPRHFRLKLV